MLHHASLVVVFTDSPLTTPRLFVLDVAAIL